MIISRPIAGCVIALILSALPARCPADVPPHNVIVFVADGLRGSVVDAATTPNLDAVRREGVAFPNSHSLFPTVTTANASAIATGHMLGDTGDFANTIFAGFPVLQADGEKSVTPFIEDDVVLGSLDAQLGGDYLDEPTLLATARKAGFSTASIGKLGPALIQDHLARDGTQTIVLDDRSGLTNDHTALVDGIPIAADVARRLHDAGLPPMPPATDKPNRAQQQYFVTAVTRVILPLFKERAKPFVMVVWMRDPDISQHNQLDSRYAMLPGINGATSIEAIRNTDRNLGDLRSALKRLGLDATTDLFVTSDHGFSTISKQSDTSLSIKCHYDDVPLGHLPPGFLALDLANALDLPLHDPDANSSEIDRRCESGVTAGKTALLARHSKHGNGVIGRDPAHPDVVVAAGAGSALIYLVSAAGRRSLPILVNFLLTQDYSGGVFVDSALGRPAGTIPLDAVGMAGAARTPHPDIVVSFRSFSTGCAEPLRCGAEVSDSLLSQGQGMHGAFSRADTYNFMAATGPDFRKHFLDTAPVSNADIALTLAQVLHLEIPAHGSAVGRVLAEALPGGRLPPVRARSCRYAPADLGRWPAIDRAPLSHLQPVLRLQTVGSTRYFDAAGLLGRTLGIEADGEECD